MRVIAAGAVVVLAVTGLFLLRSGPLTNLEARAGDLLTGWAGPGEPSRQVAIVEIDERSLEQFGRWPWPRDLLGHCVRRIREQGAAAVVLPMMFPQEDRGTPVPRGGAGPASTAATNDDALAEALSGQPATIGYSLRFDARDASLAPCGLPPLPLALVAPEAGGRVAFARASGAVCSIPRVARAAAGSGFLNAAPDRDGVLRRLPVVIEYRGQHYPSLALAAVKAYHNIPAVQLLAGGQGAAGLRLSGRPIPLEGQSAVRLRFRGPRRSFPYVSAADVLAGHVPADALRGRIAVVGGSAAGLQQPVVTPAGPLFPEVELHATAIDNLLQGDPFHRPGTALFWELLAALGAGLGATALIARRRPLSGTLIALAAILGLWTACALLVANSGILLSPVPATATLAGSYATVILLNYLGEIRRADRTQRQLVSTEAFGRHMLERSESRFQRLVENVNDAIVVDDVEGRLLFANRRFREWFGWEHKDIWEVRLEDYVAPEWQAELRDRHRRRMAGETVPDHFEFEGLRPDGTRIWIEALVTVVEENNRIAGTQAALRDITERKRMEAQYLQAQKMESVGRLAGGVAHDMNNLLTIINGYCDLMLSEPGCEGDIRNNLGEIRTAGGRAAELTQKLLAFSRKQLVKPQRLNLNLVVAEAETMFGRLIGEDIELQLQLCPGLGTVMADRGQLHQVLMNLVVNARDGMPRGGKLTIETRNVSMGGRFLGHDTSLPLGQYVYVGVADTGVGIGADVKKHLFEPFFTTKEPGKGTGLGLATCYGIVRQNGGWIGVTSEPGRGATFHICLPRIAGEESVDTSRPAAATNLRGGETILVVEDQDAVRHLARTVLSGYGYRVLDVSNGPDAIALAAQYPDVIDLLLTDVILPLMDGRTLAGKLVAARPGLRVLYMSGYSEDRIGHHGLLDAGLAYLPKPFSPEALAAKVRETLGEEPKRRAAEGAEPAGA